MASILLIEHQSLLSDAIRHFLFPRHVVASFTRLPALEELASYDVAVVDTEAIPGLNQTQEQLASLFSRANVPAVWLCPPQATMPESDATTAFVKKPLEAEAFGGAVEQLLASQSTDDARGGSIADREHIIELTDVIAEDSADEEEN